MSKKFDPNEFSRRLNTITGGRQKYAENVVKDILALIGEDPNREGVAETPARVVKAWDEWFRGYQLDPTTMLKTFEDGAEGCGDELVLVRDIEFYSFCEHHMAPFFGVAHVAYIPKDRIVGLSKFARLVDAFACRLQVQERLTNQIADTIQTALDPVGVGVVLQARHFCMCSRGVGKQGSTTVTSALRGALRTDGNARREFMGLAFSSKRD